MIRILLLPAICLLVFVSGCGLLDGDAGLEGDVEADIIDEKGTIEQLGQNGGYFIAADHAPSYVKGAEEPYYLYPLNLPEKYRQNGIRVIFSAEIEECNDVGMCFALPVTIVRIRSLK